MHRTLLMTAWITFSPLMLDGASAESPQPAAPYFDLSVRGTNRTCTGSELSKDTVSADIAESSTLIAQPSPRAAAFLGQRVALDFAMLRASDILLTDELAEYRQTLSESELTLSVSHGHIGLHYVPESVLEKENDLEEHRFGFQTSGRFRLNESVEILGGGGAYQGYTDYRSLWLNEHFDQLYSNRTGYERAHPWGCNLSGGVRWEYLPSSGFVQGDLGYQHDIVSPGYEVRFPPFPPRLIRFRDTYDSVSGRLSLENVLSPRVRTKQELQITDTTDRELRVNVQSSINFALTEQWITRFSGGYTREEPELEAWFAGATIEHDWNETWFLSLTGRYYTDTGQIEDAFLAANTASPPLETFHAGLGLRWQRARYSAKLVIGPYFTRYDASGNSANSFGHLYQDRDWLSVQLAFAHEF